MRFNITLVLFFIVSIITSAFASDVCTCNGLASNFPGVSLVCNKTIIDRTLFIDGDENLAFEVCGAERTLYLGGVVQSVGACVCMDDPKGYIHLTVEESGQSLHDYQYLFADAPGSKDEAVGSCQAQLSELARVKICTVGAQ